MIILFEREKEEETLYLSHSVLYYFFSYYRTLYKSIKIVSVQILQRTYTVNI